MRRPALVFIMLVAQVACQTESEAPEASSEVTITVESDRGELDRKIEELRAQAAILEQERDRLRRSGRASPPATPEAQALVSALRQEIRAREAALTQREQAVADGESAKEIVQLLKQIMGKLDAIEAKLKTGRKKRR